MVAKPAIKIRDEDHPDRQMEAQGKINAEVQHLLALVRDDRRVTKLVRGLLALACGVAVAGGLALAGTALGGLVGGLLIGVGVYLGPEVSDRVNRRRERVAAARERLQRVSVATAVPPARSALGPAALLRPDQQVVGFVDRPELGQLREWCDDDAQPQVLLLTGAGGVGKTRLAMQLATDRKSLGWARTIVRPDEEIDAVSAVRALNSGPVLLVVDYAETRSSLGSLLRAVAEDRGERMRVLLLARGGGEWWSQLEARPDASVRSLATTAGRMLLMPLSSETGTAGDLFQAAVSAFAKALGIPSPERVALEIPAGSLPILVLHAAALLAVLDCKDHPQVSAITLFGSGDDHVTCAGRRVARGGWEAVGQDGGRVHHRTLMIFCRSSPRASWTASS